MTAVELRWQRGVPFVDLSRQDVATLIGEPITDLTPLSGGLRNTNYRVRLSQTGQDAVLRLHTADDAHACERNGRLLDLIAATVPAPCVLRADPSASPPWTLHTWIDGQRMDLALQAASPDEMQAIVFSAGGSLAAIHAYEFEQAGFLGPNLEIAEPMSVEHGWAEWISGWLVKGHAGQRLGSELTERVLHFVDARANEMRQARQPKPVLLHADYKPWNLIVRNNQIVGVIDWEFALSGDKMLDFGIFLRHRDSLPADYPNWFAAGYQSASGILPEDWARLSRMTDLICLVQLVDRGDIEDPTRTADLRPIIEATIREVAV